MKPVVESTPPSKETVREQGFPFSYSSLIFNLKNKKSNMIYSLTQHKYDNTTLPWSLQTILDPPSNNYDSVEAVTRNLTHFGFYACQSVKGKTSFP